ncbi:MAG: AAA family ATPase [Candidatus Micrarchaeia archaeon]
MNRLKIVTVTGTPGAGKTFFSKMIAERCPCAKIIEINDILNEAKAYSGIDALGSKIASIGKLNRAIKRRLNREQSNSCFIVLSGHLAPELDLNYDLSFVVRAPLKVIERRLRERGYKKEKISENLIAEGLDYCGETIRTKSRKVYEIETQLQKRFALRLVSSICVANKQKNTLQKKEMEKIEGYLPNSIDKSPELYAMLKARKITQKPLV